jgi:hypothetical protein
MHVHKNKDSGSTVRVAVTEDVTAVDVSHDVFDGSECSFDVRSVVHSQDDTGKKLQGEEQTDQRSIAPVVVKIARGGVVEHVIG